jgi:hypothetical protein
VPSVEFTTAARRYHNNMALCSPRRHGGTALLLNARRIHGEYGAYIITDH